MVFAVKKIQKFSFALNPLFRKTDVTCCPYFVVYGFVLITFQSLNTAQISAPAKTINAKVFTVTPSRIRPTTTSPNSMKILEIKVMNNQRGFFAITEIRSAITLPKILTPVLAKPILAE